jgi:hypothetical protein
MASFDSSAVLATIATLEKELARLKGQLGVGDGKVAKPAKVKRERNPDAKPNPWIEFVKRLHSALKDVEYDGPATVVTLFGKAMKELYPDAYSLNEEALRAEFKHWLTPERLEHAKSLKRGSKKAEPEKAETEESSASAAESADEEKPKERTKRAPMSEEAKAAMAAKRAATKAAKAAGGAGAPAEPAAEPAAEKPKKGKKAEKEAVYTLEQLQDWEELTWEGAEYGRNVRGDVIDGEGNFAGHWDGKALNRAAPKPADWDTIMA